MPTISIGKRISNVKARLLDIRLGTGAVKLPKDISRIHLRFSNCLYGVPNWPMKFWRNEMIRMKYHNPAVTMTVEHTAPRGTRAIMSIHYVPSGSQQTSNSSTSSPAPIDSTTQTSTPSNAVVTTRVETLDMTNKPNKQVLQEFIKLTNAVEVEPSSKDIAELAEVKAEQARSAVQSKRGLEARMARKREQQLLEQARLGLAM